MQTLLCTLKGAMPTLLCSWSGDTFSGTKKILKLPHMPIFFIFFYQTTYILEVYMIYLTTFDNTNIWWESTKGLTGSNHILKVLSSYSDSDCLLTINITVGGFASLPVCLLVRQFLKLQRVLKGRNYLVFFLRFFSSG